MLYFRVLDAAIFFQDAEGQFCKNTPVEAEK